MSLPPSGGFSLRTVPNADALVGKMLDAFGVSQFSSDNTAHAFARLYLLRTRRGDRPTGERPESPEGKRIGQALAKLGRRSITHRGASYHLQRAGRVDFPLANRDSYETLSEAQLFAVLRELSSEPASDAARKAAFQELLAAAEDQRVKSGSTELLLLRLQRFFARAQSDGPAITPAQMRKALERHWIEVAVVDPNGEPAPGVALELQLADGSTKSATTNEDGFARLEPVPAGSTIIRLPRLDGSAWRASGSKPSGKAALDRTHLVKQGECLSRIALKYGFPDWKVSPRPDPLW